MVLSANFLELYNNNYLHSVGQNNIHSDVNAALLPQLGVSESSIFSQIGYPKLRL